MLDKPRIAETDEQIAAVIHITVPRTEIRNVMGPGLAELMAAVAAQGLKPAGAWFSHHLRMMPDTFDFEIGVPLNAPIAPKGRVKPGKLPAARVARAVYRGRYEGLSAAWGEFDAWLKREGHKPGADLWETYLAGPETGPDSSTWRTELTRPLVS